MRGELARDEPVLAARACTRRAPRSASARARGGSLAAAAQRAREREVNLARVRRLGGRGVADRRRSLEQRQSVAGAPESQVRHAERHHADSSARRCRGRSPPRRSPARARPTRAPPRSDRAHSGSRRGSTAAARSPGDSAPYPRSTSDEPAFELLQRFGELAALEQHDPDVVQRQGVVGIVGAAGAFLCRQRAASLLQSLGDPSLAQSHDRAVVEQQAPQSVVPAHSPQHGLGVPAPDLREREVSFPSRRRRTPACPRPRRRSRRDGRARPTRPPPPARAPPAATRADRSADRRASARSPPRADRSPRGGSHPRAAPAPRARRRSDRRARARGPRPAARAADRRRRARRDPRAAAPRPATSVTSAQRSMPPSALAALTAFCDHVRVGVAKQPRERAQILEAVEQARHAQVHDLGRLLAAHVRRLADVDVHRRPLARRSRRGRGRRPRTPPRRTASPSPGTRARISVLASDSTGCPRAGASQTPFSLAAAPDARRRRPEKRRLSSSAASSAFIDGQRSAGSRFNPRRSSLRICGGTPLRDGGSRTRRREHAGFSSRPWSPRRRGRCGRAPRRARRKS